MLWIIIIILTLACLYLILKYYVSEYAWREAFRETASDLLLEQVNNQYPCKLILTINFNQPSASLITDFSKYEKTKIIGIIDNETRPPQNLKEKAINGIPQYFTPALVYKVGEHWLWKL